MKRQRESKTEAKRSFKRTSFKRARRVISAMVPRSMISNKKYISGATGNATNSDVGTSYYSLNGGCTQGVTDSQRLGNEITGKYLRLHLHVVHTGATADMTGPSNYRVAIFVKTQNNNAVPVLTSATVGLWVNPAAGQIVANERAPAAKRLYKVLRDEGHTLDVVGGASNIGSSRAHEWYIPLKGLRSIYSATAGTATDIVTNGLYFAIMSAQPANTNTTFTFSFTYCFNDA